MTHMYLCAERADPLYYHGRKAVNSYLQRPGMIYVILTSSQYNSLGALLNHLYYSNSTLLKLAPSVMDGGYIGYPHNGGEHTCEISGTPGDCQAYLELLIENYGVRNTDGRYNGALVTLSALNEEVKTYIKGA